MNSIKRNSAF
jgi:hypothetical protein